MEATPEQSAEGLAIVRVLAAVLDRLVKANVPIARADPGQVTKFHAMKPPGIGIEQYLERIHKYASCSNECFVLALIYIDRLIQRSNFLLTELNVHRVVITAILLAAKFFDDAYYNNAYYAKVGGVLVSEMNGLEVDFLFRINFSLHITPEVFEKYRAELMMHSTSAATSVVTPPQSVNMEMTTQSPVVIHEEKQQPQPVYSPPITTAQHIVVATPAQTWPMVTMEQHVNVARESAALSQITPSPPAEAGKMHVVATGDSAVSSAIQQVTATMTQPPPTTDLMQLLSRDAFVPTMQRANSMPPAPYYVPQTTTTRCAPNSFSAPTAPMNVAATSSHHAMPFDVVLENQIYPGTLVHHHHVHSGFQRTSSDGTTCNTKGIVGGRMLTGVSGAGL